MVIVAMLVQVHGNDNDNGCNASSGPWQWLKCEYRSMVIDEMLVQVHGNGSNARSGP